MVPVPLTRETLCPVRFADAAREQRMKNVVIVGASTGLGRCIGAGLAARGEQVALMARRQDKIDEAAAEAGARAIAIRCDATDPASCRTAFDEAAERMGRLDAVIYAAGLGPLTKLEHATNEQWEAAFAVNVIGANNVTQAALPHLHPTDGHVIYMSTTGCSYTAPWPGLGVYQTTKAALNHLVEAWRAEVPNVNFVRVTIGECTGGAGDNQTHFTETWDANVAMEVAPMWFERKLMTGGFIDVEHLVDAFHGIVTSGNSLQIPALTIIPRPPLPPS
jgi:NAD(P)-dependent dehydrogenase (short-subunit alcohol dehydrogenase family)